MAANVGELIALFQRGAFEDVIAAAKVLAARHPAEPLILVVAGAAHAERAAWAEAEAAFRKALALAPDSVDAHYNLARTLQRQDRPEAAEPHYRETLRLAPAHHHAANNLAIVLREQHRAMEAHQILAKVLAAQPDFVDALVNLGVTLIHLNQPASARAALERALARDPACAEAWENLGLVLADLQLAEDSAVAYERCLALVPGNAKAWTGLGLARLDRRDTVGAIAAWDRALAVDPDCHIALGLKRFNQLRLADWSSTGAIPPPPEGKRPRGTIGSPLSFIALVDDPALQRRIAEATAAQAFPAVTPVPFARPAATPDRLRIAYLSADFNNHPVAQLMAGVFAIHDRARVEVFALAHSRDQRDPMTERIAASVDHFIDIAAMSDHAVAELARRNAFDVAIDLTGHTRGSRTGAFAHRLAPVQIAHLGYPGTVGAPFFDYLVADAHVISPAERPHYNEHMLLMPGSFQPNDDQRPLATEALTRAQFGLPEAGFVFCCFNNIYKITAAEWDVWMGLLAEVPGSVLWLPRPGAQAEANLKREAAARGVAPERLVFAESADYAIYIARHGVADLFLDTFTYNAHTTASDALWGGVPVLTLAGRSFAARVAASVLHAADLPELVTTTREEYAALALALASDPARLAALKARVAAARHGSALFDTRRYTRNLETGLAMAVARARAGLPPEDLAVPDCGPSSRT